MYNKFEINDLQISVVHWKVNNCITKLMVKQKHKITGCGIFEYIRKTFPQGDNLMPEVIIEQNKDIINYINMLNLPYIWSFIYSRHTCNLDRSCGSRFFGEYKWNNECVDYKRINHSLNDVPKQCDLKM